MLSCPSSQRMRKRRDGLGSSTPSTTPKRGGRSVDSDSAATRSPVLRSMSHLHVRSKHGRSPSVQPSLVALGWGGRGAFGHWWPPLGPPGFTEGPSSLLVFVATDERPHAPKAVVSRHNVSCIHENIFWKHATGC